MSKRTKRAYARTVSSCALVCSAMLLLSSPSWAEEVAHKFDIPAESTAKALNDLSTQSGIQILFPYDLAAKTMAPAIKGSYSLRVVLKQLISGSGLEIASETDKTITLRAVSSTTDEPRAEAPTEVIVTGSHIRGGNPTSPVHTIGRKDIEQSGYSQIGDVMRSLPENFAGGQNPEVFQATATNPGNQNLSNASTVNLRGLGTDATLVLLNGHRLSGDSWFQGVDISAIPLSAIQRVEVVPDGASALYGSDAVAGVVNMILRKDYDGTEVSARLGGATQGGGQEQTYNFMTGKAGGNWHMLGAYEYSNKEAITAAQRRETAGMTPQTTLSQPSERRSLFISTGRDVNSALSLTFDGLVSDRHWRAAQQVQPSARAYTFEGYTPSFNLALAANFALPSDWKLHASAVAAGSRNSRSTRTSTSYSVGHYKNDTQSLELTADGTLFALPSGPIKGAFGGGVRTEKLQQSLSGEASYRLFSRNISYLYAEILAPLVTPSPDRTGLKELELSASGRTERYSDFGTTTNPKIGLRYVPIDALTLRTTWGKSFKAPSFIQLYDDNYLFLWDAATLGGNDPGTVLMTFGGNPNLKPETSTSWTIGGDFSPLKSKSLTLSVTYFSIDYTDRVVQPVPNYGAGLSDPVYAPFVEGARTPDRQQQLIAEAYEFDNYSSGAYDPASVVAVLQDQYANASTQAIKGLDVSYRQTFRFTRGTLDAFANASTLSLKQKTISTAPTVEMAGTIFNAPKLKARGGVSWTSGGLSATGVVNFIDEETDNATTPAAAVDSWTTVDATLAYRFLDRETILQGLKLSLSASNLFDRAPPYTISPTYYPGMHFDSTNASIVGRFVSLTVSKAW